MAFGIDQQGAGGGVGLGVGPEGVVFGGEHLHPAVGDGAQRRDLVLPVGDCAGGADAAADVGGPGPQDRRVIALGPAGAELHDRAALGGAADAVGFGGDQRLEVDREEHHRLHQLGLDDRAFDDDDRFVGEDRGAFLHRPDVAGKFEIPQVVKECLAEDLFAPEEGDVLLGKVEVLEVPHQLFQAGADREAGLIRDLAEKHIEDRAFVTDAFL